MAEPIAIACDHAAIEMKELLSRHLQDKGYEVVDLGTIGTDSVDYPDFGYKLAEAMASGRASKGNGKGPGHPSSNMRTAVAVSA